MLLPAYNSTDLLQPIEACVLIPTFNNEMTLKRVIDGVLKKTEHIILINDGSTDSTADILATYSQLTILSLPQNKGKGNALQQGFKAAIASGYRYAITIDSDGQHYPEDLPVFVEDIRKNGSALLIGSRNMNQESVPGKSSFGNRFSNFWFWFETGIKLQDTQCGYRLYPLQRIKDIRFYTKKFEFEIEVIVKAAWRNIPIRNVPVNVLYDPDERVSHFRPFRDFSRISILNTWLVLVSLLYIRPRNHIRSFKKKGFRRFFYEDFLQSQDSNSKKALSVSLGLFIGLSPLWGLHTVSVLGLAYLFRLNKLIAFACSNISIPPMIPLIIWVGLKIGSWITGTPMSPNLPNGSTFDYWEFAKNHAIQYIFGSLTLAIIVASTIGVISYLILVFIHRDKK